jgi:hypothetical protein
VADDRERETERTTVVRSDGDGRSSAALVIAVIALLIVLAVVFFSGILNRNDDQDLNVEFNQPGVNVIVPDTQLPPLTPPITQPPPPDVNVNVTTPPPPPEENLGNSAVNNSG